MERSRYPRDAASWLRSFVLLATSSTSPMQRECWKSAVPTPRSCCPGGAVRVGCGASVQGAYAPVGLASLGSQQLLDDPWVLVPALYDPAYIGGRTAAEHWDLTEQIFRDIVVVTGRPVRARTQERHGTTFCLRHTRPEMIFGTRSVWRGTARIAVSDVHRTIVDMLDDPALGAGIQHVSDCIASYVARRDRDDDKLVAYADRLGNGAVFKRLGFLAERGSDSSSLVGACRERLTQGNAKLDSALPCRRLVTRWRLFVPDGWHRVAPA